mmetsp:Transcript_5873/g.14702  ORF Transcript_5873/g.14702 Transcript_5873/m.14702 type:complete len:296 (-) Transcript_5873:186-1073(-)
MCRETEVKSVNNSSLRRQRQPLAPSIMNAKSMNLITDEGFGRRLAANLLVMTIVIAFCTSNQTLQNYCLDMYYDMKEYMMRIASEMAWWSLLGLLSSSCCAIQILLNTLSFGCAGFNNVLGPLRPTFLSLSIVAQCSSWYVALTNSIVKDQWRMSAASTVLSASLTLLPEVLAWQTAKRERIRHQTYQTTNYKKEENEKTDDSVSYDSKSTSNEIKLQFQLSTMGCSSCVSTVSKVLDSIDGVRRHSVTLESGIAEIVLDEKSFGNRRNTPSNQHDQLWKDIANQLQAAGFPADD